MDWTRQRDDMAPALARLAADPAISGHIERVRAASTTARWHPAGRRLADAWSAETQVHSAQAVATAQGASVPLELVREWSVGVSAPGDAGQKLAWGALRCVQRAMAPGATWDAAPAMMLAALHRCAAADLVTAHPAHVSGAPSGADLVGRLRPDNMAPFDAASGGSPAFVTQDVLGRMTVACALAAASGTVPGVLVAALLWAELAVVQPFASANLPVALASARSLLHCRGVDRLGVCVFEQDVARRRSEFDDALCHYQLGSLAGIRVWIETVADACVYGFAWAETVGQSVLAGRLPKIS